MPRRDEIDATLAKHFAWSYVPAEETAQVDDRLRAAESAAAAQGTPPVAEEPVREAQDDQAMEEFRARSRAACKPLALATAEAWADTDDEQRYLAVKKLLARSHRLGVEIVGLQEWPVESVRLLRLLLQYGPRMTRRQRERVASVACLVPLDHPETAELLVEIARAGDAEMADALFADDEWTPEVGDEEALVARLADVVDDGPSHASRAVAIELIARFATRDPAVAALRRALHLPSFSVRARALQALATAEPPMLAPDDLVQILRDLVTHAPPDPFGGEEREEDERILADAVLTALAHVQPDAAGEALLDWIDAEHDALWLDAGWATEALAVGFPDTGAVMADHWLRCAHAHDRMKALAALERLTNELAEPRLRLAASDPAASVREVARRQWLERYGQALTVPVEELVGGRLLVGPPSDRFLAGLAVMQGRVADARRAMARALLAEAPGREALVLLLQLVGDDAESSEPLSPGREAGWAVTLVERFGALGVEGLCALAARFTEPESFAWTRRLGDLVEKGVVAREHAAPLRELAARHVLSEDAGVIDDSLRLLTLVGAPPELLDRVMAVALDDELGSWEARKLIVAWPDRSSDTRLTSDMALALAERNWTRVENAAWMALGRGAAAARVIAQRVLEVAETDEEAVNAAGTCVRGLRELGALDDAWARDALTRPQSPLFAAVARAWRGSPAVRVELEAALASTARGGASAAEAAVALLASEPPWNPRDRRLGAVLKGAPPPERAEVVCLMCVRGAPFAAVAAHLEGLFTSADPCVTQQMQGLLSWLKSPKLDPMLRQLLARVVDPELRSEIEEKLGQTPASYWAER
ncbi:MAG TPA: hypothetical protein VHS09_11320 [Polyangiaceae bacterium]|jgi:hypothetical protein|nr:hypothetical protein [Polyangiaceae bacterium]